MESFSTSRRRRNRASAARLLLSLHAGGNLDAPERWTWDVLAALPPWCLLDTQQRQLLQAVCGAASIGPGLRYWIDKRWIGSAHKLIGEAVFERIVADAESVANSDALPPDSSIIPDAKEHPSVAVERCLLGTGAAVLLATLDDSLPMESLAESLGEPIGVVSKADAWPLMNYAEALLANVPSTQESTPSIEGQSVKSQRVENSSVEETG